MPEIYQDLLRIKVPVGDEEVTFIVRRPSGKAISKFLSSRFTTHRNKQVNRLYEARIEFVDSILEDVENVTYRSSDGGSKPLTRQTTLSEEEVAKWATTLDIRPAEVSWKALIPVNWKSAVAMYFEDSAAGEESGN